MVRYRNRIPEDVHQDAIVALYTRLPNYDPSRPGASFLSWFGWTLCAFVKEHLRKERKYRHAVTLKHDVAYTAPDPVELPQILYDYYYLGLLDAEIAEKLHVSRPCVVQRRHKALEALRDS
jgi:DNA-directed RNA polymerase specialized sigma24 family protein